MWLIVFICLLTVHANLYANKMFQNKITFYNYFLWYVKVFYFIFCFWYLN